MSLCSSIVIFDHAKDRPIIFSTFHPVVALLARKLQSTYAVSMIKPSSEGEREVLLEREDQIQYRRCSFQTRTRLIAEHWLIVEYKLADNRDNDELATEIMVN
ncbi:hypothetical protein HYC85_003862 [Camellia sinensis]|uniref:Uncharacterized protein n=1 Tax=Camellia sinensis TaxID=4442 RepID=A0A7J7HW39_CAMSI|nr:hypothetical protein HYC85_003862 [Camellia sinensis]